MHRLKCLIVSAAVSTALLAVAGPAMADYISDIQNNYTNTNTQVTVDDTVSTPVVSATLSIPGTFHGKTYTNWAFYVNDSTGGMDVFVNSATLASFAGSYTPNIGDGIAIKGTYTVFDGFPELEAPFSSLSLYSTGNTPYPPVSGSLPDGYPCNINGLIQDYNANAVTVTAGTKSSTMVPNDYASQLVTLDNVWITSSGTLPATYGTSANISAVLNDSSGTCNYFYWESSYDAPVINMYGMPVLTGSNNMYDMTGFVDYFSPTVEFDPISITPLAPVPEPGTMALLGAGTTVATVGYARRKRRKSILRRAQTASNPRPRRA